MTEQLAGPARSARPGAPGPVGLPLASLLTYAPDSHARYVVTAVDARGRLADASPVRALGWPPGTPVVLHVVQGAVVVVTRAVTHNAGPGRQEGPRRERHMITRQGHLRLPAHVRHGCRLDPGARLLVAAHPDSAVLVAFTTRVLDGVLRAYYESLTTGAGAGGGDVS